MTDTQRGNQLGNYRLGPRYRDTQDTGRIYRAFNVVTGAPALVLQRTERQADEQPLADWQVRVTSSVSPPFLALEVEHAPVAGNPADVPEELMFMLGDAEDLVNATINRPETLPHLRAAHRPPPARQVVQPLPVPVPPARPSSSWRRPSLAAGLSALAAAAALFLGGSRSGLELRHDAGAELAHLDMDAGWGGAATGLVLTGTTDDLPIVLARAMPRKPFEEQKRPPCNPRLEEEHFGGCWVPHQTRPPCPDELYELEGSCFLPAAKTAKRKAALSGNPLAFDRP